MISRTLRDRRDQQMIFDIAWYSLFELDFIPRITSPLVLRDVRDLDSEAKMVFV